MSEGAGESRILAPDSDTEPAAGRLGLQVVVPENQSVVEEGSSRCGLNRHGAECFARTCIKNGINEFRNAY